jgi:hypothetical protein
MVARRGRVWLFAVLAALAIGGGMVAPATTVASSAGLPSSGAAVTAVDPAALQSQQITFTPPYSGVVGETLALSATATSGLAVGYSLAATSACTLAGGNLHFVAQGTCSVTASQPGNATWAAAPSVTMSIDATLGYSVTWSIETPDASTRAPGTIKVGDQLTVSIGAVDATPATACNLSVTSAGGWVMDHEGAIADGRCQIMLTLPAFPAPIMRANADRVDGDVCVSIASQAFADTVRREMIAADRSMPGGVACYNGSDRSGRPDDVIDFQVVDGGTPKPFVSDPPMVSWNPADWVDYAPMAFGTAAHLELPAGVADDCEFELNGSWTTVIRPLAPAGCSPWDVRLPGVLPSTMEWPGGSGDWQVQVVARYRRGSDWGSTVAYVNIPYAPSDGVFESSEPALFPTDLATTRFVTVGQGWKPAFQVSGATPSTCRMDVTTVPPTFPTDPAIDDWYDASIDADGVCHFSVPALSTEWELHQYFVYADVPSGTVVFGGSIDAIAAPGAPTIHDPTDNGGAETIQVDQGSGQGLLMNLAVQPATQGAVAAAAATSCSATAISTDLESGGQIPAINKSCSLPAGMYVATATMYDAAGKLATSTRTFTVGPAVVPAVPATFHPTVPTRLLDTRVGNGHSGKLLAGKPITVLITGRRGIPAGASAVTGTLTVTGSSAGWAVYLGPSAVSAPSTSTLNFATGQVVSNGVTVPLSATGTLSATYLGPVGATTHLVFDVTGYFTPDSTGQTYHPITPARDVDTRVKNGLAGKLTTGVPATFTVAGRNEVPAGAKAVTGNVTVVNQSSGWAVYLGPDPLAAPGSSTINFTAGNVTANSVTVQLSSAGKLSATYLGPAKATTDLVFDVTGYYTADATGYRFVPLSPTRVADSRTATGLPGKLQVGTPRAIALAGQAGVPAGAKAVAGNVTVTHPTSAWALYLGPVQTAAPTTSSINFLAGETKANGLTVSLSSTGSLWVTYLGSPGNTTDCVFDLAGYFV